MQAEAMEVEPEAAPKEAADENGDEQAEVPKKRRKRGEKSDEQLMVEASLPNLERYYATGFNNCCLCVST